MRPAHSLDFSRRRGSSGQREITFYYKCLVLNPQTQNDDDPTIKKIREISTQV